MDNVLELSPIRDPVRLPAIAGYRVVSKDIGASGEAILLYAPLQEVAQVFGTHEEAGQATFPRTHTDRAYHGMLSITNEIGSTILDLPLLTATFPMVQTLPGNRVLVVAARCASRPGFNARVYGPNGSLLDEFCLGDGIEHVQADSSGRVWVGYFDEGVLGRFGENGLVCYDSTGKKLWEFQRPEGVGPIDDCYSLNVSDEAVWTCYYSEFPVVCIDPSYSVTAWETDFGGAKALAVCGDLVLIYTGRKGKKNECRLVRLREGRAEDIADVALRLPGGLDSTEITVIGRGKSLNVFVGDEWHIFEVPRLGANERNS
ncbi:MAG TPA: hypothetical protein VKZ53_14975 [Candidatus Angelobacter sp.]|nr:hypothetical protein [Candidatus Angelobacter sp.]